MTGDQFTGSRLHRKNELYLLPPIAIHHVPSDRTEPCCTPPWTQSHTWLCSEWLPPQDEFCTSLLDHKCSYHRTIDQVLWHWLLYPVLAPTHLDQKQMVSWSSPPFHQSTGGPLFCHDALRIPSWALEYKTKEGLISKHDEQGDQITI